jgi:hypothetical protein
MKENRTLWTGWQKAALKSHIDLMCADSKGRFVNTRIEPYYSYKKIR